MGYDQHTITLKILVLRHNSEQDHIDDELLQAEIERLVEDERFASLRPMLIP